jgi:hypothetical protein
MSINSITSNPIILTELKNAIGGGGGGGGITSLVNVDGNIVVGVAGSVGNVDLAQSITIGQDLNVKGQIKLNGLTGSTNQVLTSQGSGNPIWANITPPTPTPPSIIQFFVNQQTATGQVDLQQITFPDVNFTGLTVGKTYYILFCGTFNNRGTTTPTTPNTFISYSALQQAGVVQLSTSNTMIYNVSILNKVPFSYIVKFTASSTTDEITPVIYISGTPQVNTISTDINDYCNALLLGVE